MANTVNPLGLSPTVINDLCHCFQRYPSIELVLIFGSRAKGNFWDGSEAHAMGRVAVLTLYQIMIFIGISTPE